MSLEQAFLDDVIAHPDDDAPRLVFADWLDEHGDPDRAAFIRVQCELARLPGDAPNRAALAKREQELLDQNAIRWAEPLRDMVSEWGFRRGFIDYVSLDFNHDAYLDDLPRLFRLAPLQALELQEFRDETISALLALPEQVARLRYLSLFALDDVRAGEFRKLMTSPSLSNLETFFLDHEIPQSFPLKALDVLGQSPTLSRLRELGLAVGDVAADLPKHVVRSLARSPYLRLSGLYLIFTAFDQRLMRQMLRSPVMQHLEQLSLQSCSIDERALGEMLQPDVLPSLKMLRLHGVEMEERTRSVLLDRFGSGVLAFEENPPFEGNWFPKRAGLVLRS